MCGLRPCSEAPIFKQPFSYNLYGKNPVLVTENRGIPCVSRRKNLRETGGKFEKPNGRDDFPGPFHANFFSRKFSSRSSVFGVRSPPNAVSNENSDSVHSLLKSGSAVDPDATRLRTVADLPFESEKETCSRHLRGSENTLRALTQKKFGLKNFF